MLRDKKYLKYLITKFKGADVDSILLRLYPVLEELDEIIDYLYLLGFDADVQIFQEAEAPKRVRLTPGFRVTLDPDNL